VLPVLRNDSGLAPYRGTPVNRIATLFDRVFGDDLFAPLTAAPAWTALPLSVWEDEDHVHVEADLPGVTDKDIEVSVHQGELVIRGERKCERQEARYDTRYYGRFEQRVSLPSPVDADKAEARLANGVLRLSTYLLYEVLEPDRPEDALAYLALTASDLWPGEGWNFVFGQANLRRRVGVWSLYRNGDPGEGVTRPGSRLSTSQRLTWTNPAAFW
jgi:HSP20 family molecular chaperone IbpA